MAGYNRTREVEELLERTEHSPPSFTIHLHAEYWVLNNGSKFLYNNQIASLLDDIRAHRIPVDFLDLFESARVPFYSGCMIVELLDYRPQKNKEVPEKPERTRVVLHPDSETLWADICLLNQKHGNKWTDHDALEIEARLLLATSPPLCLDPDPRLTRVANHILRVSTPTVPVSLKRKSAVLDPEEDETDKARRAKVMQFMNPRPNRSHAPTYRILDAIKRVREAREAAPPPQIHEGVAMLHHSAPVPVPPPMGARPASPTHVEDPSNQALKKKDAAQSPYSAADVPTASKTPVSQPTPQQFAQQNLVAKTATPPPAASPSLQAQPFTNGQQVVESAKRTPTPAQKQYSQSPQVTKSQPLPVTQPAHPQQHSRQQPQSQSQPQAQAHPPTLPTFQQPTAPNAHFTPAANRSAPIKGAPPTTTPQGNPQQPSILPAQQAALNAHYYAQLQQMPQQHVANLTPQQRMAAQQQTASGRATPQGMALNSAPPRNSPLATSQPLTSRSPMPQNPPQLHPAQLQHNMNFAQSYGAGHVRPMVHANQTPHQQALASHMANRTQSSPSPIPIAAGQPAAPQDQNQQQPQPQHPHMMQYPQMFNYAQMGMNFPMPPGRMPAGYWQMGIGRGMPGVNGQAAPGIPTSVAHAQQVALGAGRAASGAPSR